MVTDSSGSTSVKGFEGFNFSSGANNETKDENTLMSVGLQGEVPKANETKTESAMTNTNENKTASPTKTENNAQREERMKNPHHKHKEEFKKLKRQILELKRQRLKIKKKGTTQEMQEARKSLTQQIKKLRTDYQRKCQEEMLLYRQQMDRRKSRSAGGSSDLATESEPSRPLTLLSAVASTKPTAFSPSPTPLSASFGESIQPFPDIPLFAPVTSLASLSKKLL